jgi:hypothetical protein
MRIILSCLQSLRRHDIPAYDFWRTYFVEGCREAAIEVLEVPGVDWAEGLTHAEGSEELDAWRSRTWEKTLTFAREEQERGGVDFFLGYLYPDQVEVSAVRDLQRAGIPCVNFFCDNVREFRKVPAAYAPFDLHWVPEYEALPMYRWAGLPHIHAPMPCWIPEKLRTMPERESEPPTFIGSADVLRRNLLGWALQQGASFTVRGPGWSDHKRGSPSELRGRSGDRLRNQVLLFRRHGLAAFTAKALNLIRPLEQPPVPLACIAPSVFGDDYLRVTREATVTIGVNRVPVTRRPLRYPLAYSRLRDIEAPMLGACYLTEHTEGVAALYEVGKEVETYSNADQLVEKLNELFRDEQKRSKLRFAGQQRALREHSVAVSLRRVADRLGIAARIKTSSSV